MANQEEQTAREKAAASIQRMQEFETTDLAREGELGHHFAFTNAVDPARRLVDLYRRLAISVLDDLPQSHLNQLAKQADQDFNRFQEILDFDPTQENAQGRHNQLIEQLSKAYEGAFNKLHPFISYSLYKSADFDRLEDEARSTLQGIRDKSETLTKELEQSREQADRILEEVRKVAAEQGVTQQASYFKESADSHEIKAEKWKTHLVWTSVVLGAYAVLSILIHKVPFLTPDTTFEAAQLVVSKVLVFTVISYYLYLSARNYLSHKHNSIVDRHRQNALMTYQALVDAAGNTPNREVLLVQAGACIFGPQTTGYARESTGAQQPGAQSVVEFMSQPLKATGAGQDGV